MMSDEVVEILLVAHNPDDEELTLWLLVNNPPIVG